MIRGSFAAKAGLRRAAPWLLAIAIAACNPANAADNDLFEVLDIKVDETDETAAAAREKALQTGERLAWDALVQRFVDPQQPRLPPFSQQQIGDAVKDFWVSAEKTSPVRYIATLNYNFHPQRVERLLSSRGVRFTTARSDPLVVVPVYVQDGANSLWDDPNPWRQAWQDLRLRSLVVLKVPRGDIGDLSTIAVDQALAGDRARLAELAQRHDAADALVAIAKVEPSGAAEGQQLRAAAIRYNAALTQPLADRSFPVDAAGVTPDLLQQAALALARDMDAAYRRGWTAQPGLLPPGQAKSSSTRVVVPVSSLEDWVAMRKRLASIPQVERMKLVSLSREAARLTIVYPGPTEDLGTALSQAGLFLYKQEGEWTVSTEPAPPSEPVGAIGR